MFDINIAISCGKTGAEYNQKANYQKALEYYNKFSEIIETVFGKNHPETAASYASIGNIYSN